MAVTELPKTPRSWWKYLIIILFFIGASVFVWRVFYFADLIQSGQMLKEVDLSFAKDLSKSTSLATVVSQGTNYEVVSDDDPRLGNKDARLTIVEFADFGCPYSRQVSFLVRSLAKQYEDQIQYIYRDFPLDELHPQARLAAQAGECAQDQGSFWEYHDKLYQNQFDLSEDRLLQHAMALDLHMYQFRSCLEKEIHATEVQKDYEDGVGAGVYGTPTFFFNGFRIPGSIPADTFRTLIEQFLQETPETLP